MITMMHEQPGRPSLAGSDCFPELFWGHAIVLFKAVTKIVGVRKADLPGNMIAFMVSFQKQRLSSFHPGAR